ncbi:hypothetical protein ACRE_005120 [Hapsidospora chrysogenum ATCC 11550]|uniref:Uncharacterized protein n=1 Tax=Hapsidospora chrysogenum (strain ATCC 11550 / CBS 779.69 / DSM 880 / IAM 14645 / JCM 23072 / IMI 49137) TaxID=857340 RepID=A0A086THI0_HAPC1|nr:hypothetical protein ACRE_005120 [Hapsidospora chrysogenum ATCC 11550]
MPATGTPDSGNTTTSPPPKDFPAGDIAPPPRKPIKVILRRSNSKDAPKDASPVNTFALQPRRKNNTLRTKPIKATPRDFPAKDSTSERRRIKIILKTDHAKDTTEDAIEGSSAEDSMAERPFPRKPIRIILRTNGNKDSAPKESSPAADSPGKASPAEDESSTEDSTADDSPAKDFPLPRKPIKIILRTNSKKDTPGNSSGGCVFPANSPPANDFLPQRRPRKLILRTNRKKDVPEGTSPLTSTALPRMRRKEVLRKGPVKATPKHSPDKDSAICLSY